MPTYTINGKRYTTQQPLTQTQLEQLVAKVTGETSEPTNQDEEPSYFDQVKQSAISIMPELGGLSGAATGAVLGAPLGPAGALIGGAIGAFTGAGAGEAGRQLITGEAGSFEDLGSSFTDVESLKRSGEQAAQTLGKASLEGILDVTGAKAVDIIVGGAKQLGRLLPKSRVASDEAAVVELQQELQRRGATLRGTQAKPEDAVVEGLESAAEGGIGTRSLFNDLAEAQQRYMDEQIDALINSQSRLTTEQTGDLMHNLIENTRIANSEAFQEVFNALEAAGKGVKINIMGIRQFAGAGKYEAMEGLTRSAKAIAERGGKVPFLDSQIKSAYDDILSLTPNMSFTTAFRKLKSLKNRLTALKGDPATANDPAVAELAGIVKNFEDQMLKQAGKVNPDIVKQYTEAMEAYSKSQKTLFNDTMVEALKKDPELVARTLLAPGRTTPIKDIKKLVAEAKKLKAKGKLTGEVSDPLQGLRRSFLEGALSGEGGQGISQMRGLESKLADPEFRRTFEALFDAQTVAKVDKLIKQAQILSRGPGGELALSVRSRQVTAAESVIRPDRSLTQRAVAIITAMTPNKLAQFITNPSEINRLLNIQSTVLKAYREGKEIPAAALRGLITMVGADAVGIEGERRSREAEAARQRYGIR